MRVLLVEDEPRLSRVIKKGLIEDGFAIDTAFDGEEGLYLAESETYDAIVLDIGLPKLDGLKYVGDYEVKTSKPDTYINCQNNS